MYTSSNTVVSARGGDIVIGIALSLVLLFVTMGLFTPTHSNDLSTHVPPSSYSTDHGEYFALMISNALSACIPSSNYWEPMLPMEYALAKHSGLYWNDRIYVMGGVTGTGAGPSATNGVWRVEISADGLATGWRATNSMGLSTLWHAAAVVTDGYIYVIGGHDGQEITGTTYSTHINSDGNTTGWVRSPHLITPGRDMHQAVVSENRLYVLGGYTYDGKVTDEIWGTTLDGSGGIGRWSKLNGGLKEPLLAFAAVMYRDWIYILGGWNSDAVTDNVYFARLEGDLVNRVYTNTTPLPVRMYRLTAFVLQGRIFVVGGRAYDQGIAHSCAGIWSAEIDSINGTLGPWEREHTLPLALESHTTILVEDGNYMGQVYVIGGEEDGQSGRRHASVFFWPLTHLSKTAYPSGIVYPSDQITYTITYSNVGARLLQGVIITDTVPVNTQLISDSISGGGYSDGSVITWTIENLSRGATGNVSFQVEVVDPSAVGVLSTVPITASTPRPFTQPLVSVTPALLSTRPQTFAPNNPETFEQDCISGNSVPSCADLSLEKSSDQASVVAGQALTYTLLVYNDGPVTAEDVVVTDDLPGGVTLTLATPPPSSTSPLTWYLGSIVSETSQVITLVVEVGSGTSGTLINTASVDSSTPDPNSDNNRDEERTDVVIRQADLRIAKFDDPDPANPGGTLTYTLWITNAGPSEATNVIVTDTLPAECGLLDSLPSNCSRHGLLVCDLGTLPAGGSKEIQVKVTVCPTSTGTLLNGAEVRSDVPDDKPDNNKVQEQTTITLADLRIKKGDSLSNGKVIPGETLVYSLWVNNDGPSDAQNVVVSDTLPPGVSFRSSVPPLIGGSYPLTWSTGTLTAGEVWTIEITVAVNSSAIGLLTNTVCVKSDDFDPNLANNCDRERILAPVSVVNRAYICEDGLWCKEAVAINPPFSIYLPIVLKASNK